MEFSRVGEDVDVVFSKVAAEDKLLTVVNGQASMSVAAPGMSIPVLIGDNWPVDLSETAEISDTSERLLELESVLTHWGEREVGAEDEWLSSESIA